MSVSVTVEQIAHRWVVLCSQCGEVARRELDLDAEALAQRHFDEHARQRRVA